MLIADDLDKMLDILPDFVKKPLINHNNHKNLIEIVMDLGRRPEARFPDGPEYLSSKIISWHDLDYCIKRIGHFSGDNRSGIEYTLHRISSIKNRQGNIIGLTCRVGRAIFGTISIIRDLLDRGNSLLLLGKPGVGKTTAIREIARVLADEMEKRVVIIDTSNEIAGDGDIPHPAIGRARRMQVMRPEQQHQVMIEAVENHMPEVIIIDEIGTELEALAARTIAERGVQLVGTAHGNCLESLIKNPVLSDLIGGIQYVTLGDEEAKRRGSQKSIIERKALPAFQVAIEIHDRNSCVVHEKVDQVVDQILQGSNSIVQSRNFGIDGSIYIRCDYSNSNDFVAYNNTSMKVKKKYSEPFINLNNIKNDLYSDFKNVDFFQLSKSNKEVYQGISLSYIDSQMICVYPYGLNIKLLETTINTLSLNIVLTRDIMKADIILALRSNIKYNNKIRQLAKSKKITIYTIHSSTTNNIMRALKKMLNLYNTNYICFNELCKNKTKIQLQALLEMKFAIEKIIILKHHSVELLPRIATIRELQYHLLNLYNFKAQHFGEEPNRFLRIYPY
uniref:AAA+ ATPase domain-containing protein n=1 Tax=Sphondylothamnion multifidum TaxID=193186 RepID=A0A4D6X1E3_9FLOR|nr:hypothetical protein [Sphondylothamnion multifidum]